MSKKIKVGVFGARRGTTMIGVMARHPDAELVAVCDYDEGVQARIQKLAGDYGSNITCYADFDQFMNHDMDAVVLANYATEHAPYAIRLLDSGRHVTSEVLAVQTMAEAVALVEAVERNPKQVYAYAENYCYFKGTMEMQRLYRDGAVGEFLHGEGEYVHDCESIWVDITRGEKDHWRNWVPSTFYCTHAIGPIVTITGTRPTKVVGFETPNLNKRRFGARSGDGAMLVCQMSNGATAKFLPWANFKRLPDAIWYAVYGTKGMMETDRWGEMYNRVNVFVEGDEHAATNTSYTARPHLETELSRRIGGHGGSDFFTMHFFVEAIQGQAGGANIIDVYQALDMTLPGTLGYRSIWEGNLPLTVPDFRPAAGLPVREQYRNDHWCCDPKLAGPGQPDRSCSWENVQVPDEVYERQATALK